jgi:hypothetical protein
VAEYSRTLRINLFYLSFAFLFSACLFWGCLGVGIEIFGMYGMG